MIDTQTQFTKTLLKWNRESNTRQMPWKGEKNPYLIWLSEVILQQTRVEQGLPYFVAFKQKYPEVKHLAMAKEDEVMRLWQGLGYYSRARNLHETAKNIHVNYKGLFPGTFDELKKLKGVGEYTASAIASFAFGERKAVVDGNVIRVLSRIFGIATPFDTTEGKKEFTTLAQSLIDKKEPGAYNQAIMDFGATICLPQNPLCNQCPLQKICIAFNKNIVAELPVRKNRTEVKNRYFTFLVIKSGQQIIIEKRKANDIWKDLYQFPLIETAKPLKKNFNAEIAAYMGNAKFTIRSYSKDFVQLLTHRKIHARFIEIEPENFKSLKLKGAEKVKLKDLHKLPFPKTIHLYLTQNSLL